MRTDPSTDPRAGGNYVQPVEDHKGNHSYEVYLGWKLLDVFDEEAEAHACLLGQFSEVVRSG